MVNNRHSLKHKKELYYIFLIVVVGGILLLSIIGPNGYIELKGALLKVQQQKARVDALERSNRQLFEENKSLSEDPEAVERYARKKGYGRDNEIIQQVPENSGKEPESEPVKE